VREKQGILINFTSIDRLSAEEKARVKDKPAAPQVVFNKNGFVIFFLKKIFILVEGFWFQ
jgi:hypothetical protein